MSGTVDLNAPPLNVVTRAEWGALPPTGELENINPPCISVRLWTYSDTPSCTTQDECVKIVRQIQQRDMRQGLDDIRYNFLIGCDGNAYEGRGYTKMPPKDEIMSEIWGRYLEICFIGDHRLTPRTNQIYEIVYQLTELGVFNGSVSFDANAVIEE